MRSRFADHRVEEFRNAHARGVQGEGDVLRDFFGNPRIRRLLELQGSPRVGPAP